MSLTKIQIVTSNQILSKKLELELIEEYECTTLSAPKAGADVYLIDRDTSDAERAGAIYLSRQGGDISVPFRIGEVSSFLKEMQSSSSVIFAEDYTVIIKGKRIRLTEVEHALFRAIYEKDGETATREELIRTVWGEGADAGILNVYVHYLRQKLEADGEKIILSTRGHGYSVNKKLLGGATC